MERMFVRETPDKKLVRVIEKQKIGVVGMNGGAGATFIATSLAVILSEDESRRVTFLEISDRAYRKTSLLYDSIGMDKRFKTREFTRFYSTEVLNGNIKGKTNIDEGINWGLITPDDIKDETEISQIEIIRLFNNISGDLLVCDISDCGDSCDYLIDMDLVIFVIDPMPSRLIAGYPLLREVKRLEYRGKKVIWIINKYNSGINKRELRNFLKLKEHYKIPLIASEKFYGAEYNCRVPYEQPDIRGEIGETMERIVKKEFGRVLY